MESLDACRVTCSLLGFIAQTNAAGICYIFWSSKEGRGAARYVGWRRKGEMCQLASLILHTTNQVPVDPALGTAYWLGFGCNGGQ